MGATAQAQVEKFLVKNNTAGHVGVVRLDHKGDPYGDNIEPYGSLWMSEQEMLETARAPRRPEDNPFEEQTLIGINPETQARQEFKVRPLTLETDDTRYLPTSDRYVPTQDAPQGVAPSPSQTAAAPPEPVAAPPSTGSTAGQAPPPPPQPAVAQAAAPAPRVGPDPAPAGLGGQERPEDGPERESWVQTPEAPGEILSGSLSGDGGTGDEESAPEPTNHPATEAGERFIPPVVVQAAPQTFGAEEHAAAVDPQVGEETGAAKPPSGDAPEGEFARAEEVGSPDAPAANSETQNGG